MLCGMRTADIDLQCGLSIICYGALMELTSKCVKQSCLCICLMVLA
jgi:hypothetical protein